MVIKDIIQEEVVCSCGEPPTPGYSTCLRCREYIRNYMTRRRVDKQAEGMCRTCGAHPAKEGRKTCQRCLDQISTANASRVARNGKPATRGRKHYAGENAVYATCGLRLTEKTKRVTTIEEFWQADSDGDLCRKCYRAATNEASPL